MNRYARLAAQLFDTPLLIHPDKAQILGDVLAARIVGLSPDEASAVAGVMSPEAALSPDQRKRFGTRVTMDGIAIIPVDGTLVKRSLGMRAYSGMRAYEDIQESVIDAATDPYVRGILLDIDSPGGEVSGLPDLGDALAEAAQLKPMWAAANDNAYSAAYWIAATAERIYVTRTSGIGSVGVIMVHWEMSKGIEESGYKVRVFRFGDHKAEVNHMEPLTEHAIAAVQEEIDRLGEMFLGHVAKHRGMSPDAVRATEAGTYHGPGGIKIGYPYAMGTVDDAHAALVAHLNDRSMSPLRGTAALQPSPEEESMGDKKTPEVSAEEQDQPAKTETAPEPAAAAAPSVPQKDTQVVDINQATAAARLEERGYQKAVRQMCALAGKPERADAFIDAGTSVDAVSQALIDARVEEDQAGEIAGQHEGRVGGGDRPPVDMAAVQADAFGSFRKVAQ